MKSVTIWSKGTRMAGDLYPPVNLQPGQKYPVVVCCHGWSAPLKNVVRDTGLPDKLAAAGFFVNPSKALPFCNPWLSRSSSVPSAIKSSR